MTMKIMKIIEAQISNPSWEGIVFITVFVTLFVWQLVEDSCETKERYLRIKRIEERERREREEG